MNFDFRKIQTEHPKAFKLLIEYIKRETWEGSTVWRLFPNHGWLQIAPNENEKNRRMEFFNSRNLDAFFDEQGIYGYASCFREIIDGETNLLWAWNYVQSDYEGESNYIFPSRSEALVALWTKEFEILESKLIQREK